MGQRIVLTILLLSIPIVAQNTYNVQPGVKNNQIVLQLSNVSTTESAEISSFLNPSRGGTLEYIRFVNNKEQVVSLKPGEEKDIVFTFDVNYNIGKTEADTVEFILTDNKSVFQTRQFILRYAAPTEYKLEQNYPNPFNPTTKIRFTIPASPKSSPKEGTFENVTLKVYDILGNEVTTLTNEQKEPGYYEVDFNASNFASGVYLYRLQSGDYISMKKMLLLK
ncbi:MAG: T9SS type A sorting domain-containing protein [Ignavibacteriales bacterium]|nr:T9SS type A sorting domain-containing protein [Ignavibacteriales bacterium]